MQISRALLGGVFAAATLTGPALAQTPAAPAPPAAKPAAPEAAKPAVSPAAPATPAATVPVAKPKTITGEVVSVNAETKTLVVKRMVEGKATELTFHAEKAAAALGDLKPGEMVRVTYVEDKGQSTATTVVKAKIEQKAPTAAAPAKAPAQPETKPKP